MFCRSNEFRKERQEISCRKAMTNFEVQNECAVAYSKYLLTTGYSLTRQMVERLEYHAGKITQQ